MESLAERVDFLFRVPLRRRAVFHRAMARRPSREHLFENERRGHASDKLRLMASLAGTFVGELPA